MAIKLTLIADFKKEVEKIKKEKVKEMIQSLKNHTPVDTGYARDHWNYVGKNIVNPVDYIVDLNRGSSMQAPAYFIETAVLSVDNVSPNGIIVVTTAPTE